VTVTADDVTATVGAAVQALSTATDADWSVRAGDLEWDCWETAEHVADDLFFYAAQLGAPDFPDYLPLRAEPNHEGGEPNTIRVPPEAGVAGLLATLMAMGALLAAMVRTAGPETRGHHTFGAADGEASAAMGVLETLVHVHDLAAGLGVGWDPDRDLCARVLARLMPEVPRTDDAWADLLWACGRIELDGRPRRPDGWRWDNTAQNSAR
jgi:hypothetical protein